MENQENAQKPDRPREGERKLPKFLSLPWGVPIATFIATALFLRYLNLIGRPDLFLPTFSNTSGIFAFISVFLLLTIACLFAILSPSVFLAAMSHQLRKEIQGEAADKLPRAIFFLGVGNVITLCCIFQGRVIAGLLVGPTLGVIIHFMFLNRHFDKHVWSEIFKGVVDGKSYWKANAFQYATVLWFCGVMTVLPLLLAFPFISTDSSILAVLILALIALGSLMPAWVYCMLASQGKTWTVLVSRFLWATLVLVFYVLLAAPESLDRVLERAALLTGLRIDAVQRYLVSNAQLDPSLLDTGGWNSKEEKHGISLDAIVPFSFGDLVLLCPESLQKRENLKELAMGRCMLVKRESVFRLPILVGS